MHGTLNKAGSRRTQMFQEERLKEILNYLNRNEKINVEDICQTFNVSRDTARRDIVKLEEQGLIVRTRGGAVLPMFTKQLINYEQRLKSESVNKQAIGRAAASLIKSKDYLLLDSSTTVQHAASFITASDLVVVTNSIDIASLITRDEENQVYVLGGLLHPKYRYMYGPRAISQLAEYTADKLFLGSSGIGVEGIYSFTEEYGFLMREMIRRADQKILLADDTKIGKKTFHLTVGWNDIDLLITNKQPDESLLEVLDKCKVELMVVDASE
jgi:DeoR/GlpR family transcriptional regulator of sugar metabolism